MYDMKTYEISGLREENDKLGREIHSAKSNEFTTALVSSALILLIGVGLRVALDGAHDKRMLHLRKGIQAYADVNKNRRLDNNEFLEIYRRANIRPNEKTYKDFRQEELQRVMNRYICERR